MPLADTASMSMPRSRPQAMVTSNPLCLQEFLYALLHLIFCKRSDANPADLGNSWAWWAWGYLMAETARNGGIV